MRRAQAGPEADADDHNCFNLVLVSRRPLDLADDLGIHCTAETKSLPPITMQGCTTRLCNGGEQLHLHIPGSRQALRHAARLLLCKSLYTCMTSCQRVREYWPLHTHCAHHAPYAPAQSRSCNNETMRWERLLEEGSFAAGLLCQTPGFHSMTYWHICSIV